MKIHAKRKLNTRNTKVRMRALRRQDHSVNQVTVFATAAFLLAGAQLLATLLEPVEANAAVNEASRRAEQIKPEQADDSISFISKQFEDIFQNKKR